MCCDSEFVYCLFTELRDLSKCGFFFMVLFQVYLIYEKIHKPNFMSCILSFETRKGGHVSLHLSF